MVGIRWPPEDSDTLPASRAPTPADLVSDDDWSVAADSWSIKSDYESNMDLEQQHVDAAEVLSNGNFLPVSDYSSDKDVPDANEVETSMLGLQSYWDATYAENLANFHEHSHAGEVWFGIEVTDAMMTWTEGLYANMSQGWNAADNNSNTSESRGSNTDLSSLSVLDIGTGNGLLLQEFAKQGNFPGVFSDLTGTDYSQGAIELAQNLADRDGFSHVKFSVDDILETKLDRKYHLVVDKGALDSIGMHPDGPVKRSLHHATTQRMSYCKKWKLLNCRRMSSDELDQELAGEPAVFQYLHHLQSSPSIMFVGGRRISCVHCRFRPKMNHDSPFVPFMLHVQDAESTSDESSLCSTSCLCFSIRCVI